MKAQELITNAKAKKAILLLNHKNKIGIRFNHKYTYHWFDIINDNVYFNHSYSQKTGKTQKGMMHRIRVEKSLGYYNK